MLEGRGGLGPEGQCQDRWTQKSDLEEPTPNHSWLDGKPGLSLGGEFPVTGGVRVDGEQSVGRDAEHECVGGWVGGGHTSSSLNPGHTSPSVPDGLFSRGLGLGTPQLAQAGLPASGKVHTVARLLPALRAVGTLSRTGCSSGNGGAVVNHSASHGCPRRCSEPLIELRYAVLLGEGDIDQDSLAWSPRTAVAGDGGEGHVFPCCWGKCHSDRGRERSTEEKRRRKGQEAGTGTHAFFRP